MTTMVKNDIKVRTAVILLAILLLACIAAFLAPEYNKGHDTEFHVVRMEYLAESIRHGEWNPAVFPDAHNGYGYGSPLFYSNFMLYLPALLVLMKVPPMFAYELFCCLIALTAILTSFYLAKKVVGSDFAAVVCAALYTGSYYFAADITVRSALGESLAFAVFPVVMLGIYRSAFGEYRRNYPLIIGFFLVAVSHNLSLLMMGVLFALFILCCIKRYISEPGRIGRLVLDAAAVVLLAAFFLFPMAEQMLNAKFFTEISIAEFNPSTAGVRLLNMFVELGEDLFDYSPSLGWTMAAVLLLFLFAQKKPKGNDVIVFRDLCVLGALACIFMASKYFPYRQLDPLLNALQFPWRWFMPATMFLAFAGAEMTTAAVRNKSSKWVTAVAVVIVILCCVQHLQVSVPTIMERYAADETSWSRMVEDSDSFRFTDENYLHRNNIRSEWRNNRDGAPHAETESDSLSLTGSRDYDVYTMEFSGNDPDVNTWFEAPLVYYYGYHAVNKSGEELETRPSWRGFIDVYDARRSDTVTISYRKTPAQNISPFVSLITAAGLAAETLIHKRRKRTDND